MYDDAVCVNTAVEINVLDYSITVRQRMAPYTVSTGLYAHNAMFTQKPQTMPGPEHTL